MAAAAAGAGASASVRPPAGTFRSRLRTARQALARHRPERGSTRSRPGDAIHALDGPKDFAQGPRRGARVGPAPQGRGGAVDEASPQTFPISL